MVLSASHLFIRAAGEGKGLDGVAVFTRHDLDIVVVGKPSIQGWSLSWLTDGQISWLAGAKLGGAPPPPSSTLPCRGFAG